MSHEYYYRNRPPGIGCQPDGFDPDTREWWRPRKDVNGISYHGKVSYSEPLSPWDIYRFELRPVDLVEYAEYIFWREIFWHEGSQEGDQPWLREDYLSADRALLEEHAPHDILARAALIILDAQKENENVNP